MPGKGTRSHADRDILLRVLEAGLCTAVIVIPLPFGAVGAGGRLLLEGLSLFLLLLWAVRAVRRGGPSPGRSILLGMAGLLALALFQMTPLGDRAVSVLSPQAEEIRRAARPGDEVLRAEQSLLGVDPSAMEPVSTISVAPALTASAVRTGAAMGILLLVSFTVVAERGARTLAISAAVSGGFQAVYGVLVLVSGHDMIWHLPKRYYLDCATGTFVNRNHFAGFLAATTALALSVMVSEARVPSREIRSEARLAAWFSRRGSRSLMVGILVALGLAGLLLSFSRAGIAVGMAAAVWVGLVATRKREGVGLAGLLAIGLAAIVPLAYTGIDRLAARFAAAPGEFTLIGGRLTVWTDTVSIVRGFPMFGAGFGCFGEVYPAFRSPEVRFLYEHAHNDALQLLAEGGAVAALLAIAILVPIVGATIRGLCRGLGVIGVGAAAALAALFLHSMVDFHFHIPANAALLSILAGTVLGLSWRHRTSASFNER